MRTQDNGEANRFDNNVYDTDEYDLHPTSLGAFNIMDIFRILLKWWWLIAAITLISLLVTAYFVSRQTPVYMASSILEIKQQERQILDNGSDIQDFVVDNEFFNTQIELLKSDSLAGDIVDQFNLVSDPDFAVETGSRLERRNAAIKLFAGKLKVSGVGRSRLIEVSFQHTNRKQAANIANAVTDSSVTYNL